MSPKVSRQLAEGSSLSTKHQFVGAVAAGCRDVPGLMTLDHAHNSHECIQRTQY